MQHTPTPWKFRPQAIPEHGFYIETVDMNHTKTFIGEIGGGLHSPAEIKANAEFVIEAVNNYEALENEVITLKREMEFALMELENGDRSKAVKRLGMALGKTFYSPILGKITKDNYDKLL